MPLSVLMILSFLMDKPLQPYLKLSKQPCRIKIAMHIRTLKPNEASLHREIRLRALQDSPDSFGETYAVAAAKPFSDWEALTRSVTDPKLHVMFLACQDEAVLGSVYGLIDRNRTNAGRVGSLWVDAAYRQRGIGRSLLQSVITWAQQREMTYLSLWSPAQNPIAIKLYEKFGFCATGEQKPLPINSAVVIIRMECHL
jgi:ribosomal protein S18 acetylase RimI-like enzyme